MDYEAMPVAPGGEGLMGHNAAFRSDRIAALRRNSRSGRTR